MPVSAFSLSDGTPVELRQIRADDKELLKAGYEHLSERSRLRRFLGPKPRLTASDLRYLTEVDGVNHYAVVALWGRHIVGVARWVRLIDDPEEAEVAVVVGDPLQGKGSREDPRAQPRRRRQGARHPPHPSLDPVRQRAGAGL